MEKAENEDAAIEHVIDRLVSQFPDVPENVVQETVTEIHDSFDQAPVRDFVAVIVEHDAKDQLRAADAAASADE